MSSAESDADGGPDPPPPTLARWQKDVAVLHEAVSLMFRNRFQEAEDKIDAASVEVEGRTLDFAAGDHDMRGMFAVTRAILSLLNGVVCLQRDQLDIVLVRLKDAEEKMGFDREWAGKKLYSGACILTIGVIQLMQLSLARGIWNVLRSWRYLRTLTTEGLHFKGHERDVVRSTSLYVLGQFCLIASLLPPKAVMTATWLTGFKGGRDEGLSHLRMCWEEEGIQAPMAGLALALFALDTSDFLGEPFVVRQERYKEARQILDWAMGRYPDSFLWQGLEVRYLCCMRDLASAIGMAERNNLLVKDLPALKFIGHVSLAKNQLARLEYVAAAENYRAAAEVHRAVERRALCPELLFTAHLCHVAAGEELKAAEALQACLAYSTEKKKWGENDADSLQKAKVALDAAGNACTGRGSWRPVLQLCVKVVVVYRAVYHMSSCEIEAYLAVVRKEIEACNGDPDNHCLGIAIHAEALRQAERWDEALCMASEGLSLELQLSNTGRHNGALQYLQLVAAYAHFMKGNTVAAKDALTKLDALPAQHAFLGPVAFKAAYLRQSIGMEMKESYLQVDVSPRQKARIIVKMPVGIEGELVQWDWTLNDYSVNFLAIFTPAERPSEPIEVQRVEQHPASAGPIEGNFQVPSPGTLELIFDNKFSMLRSKTLQCRILPNSLDVTQEVTS